MYVSNAIEAINCSFKKVTKQERFPMRQRCSSFYIFVSQYEQFHDRLNNYLNK